MSVIIGSENLSEKKSSKQKYGITGNIMFLLRDIWKDYRLLFFMLLVETVVAVAEPVFVIWLPKLAVDFVLGELDVFAFTVFICAMVITRAISGAVSQGKYMEYNDLRNYYHRKIFDFTLRCEYGKLESEEGQTAHQKARRALDMGDWSGTSRMITSALMLVTGSLSFILFSGVIATLNPLILILLASLSLINWFALGRAQKFEQSKKDEMAKCERKLNYIERTAENLAAGKDIRLYGMSDWLLTLRKHLLGDYMKLTAAVETRNYGAASVGLLLLLLRDGLSYAYLIWCVTQGSITVSEFVLYFGAITGFSGWITRIIECVDTLKRANYQINDMRCFLESDTDCDKPRDYIEVPKAEDGFSIEFRDVSFAYAGSDKRVLEHFSLKLNKGERLALVGVNGAGKTTVVKLLCGFYTPDSGNILINGVDIRRFDKRELFELFSAVFQDIFILPVTVAENISMKPFADTDKGRVEACLERAGIADEISKYSEGIKTLMLREMSDDGIVLSGGGQQKLMAARMLYKDAPILILDEPTAALDPIAESEVYQSFREMSSSVSGEAKTVIFISHRLASTRFCDRIAVLSHGRVSESGSHEELMRSGGEYAEMFAIQSHYYSEEGRISE